LSKLHADGSNRCERPGARVSCLSRNRSPLTASRATVAGVPTTNTAGSNTEGYRCVSFGDVHSECTGRRGALGWHWGLRMPVDVGRSFKVALIQSTQYARLKPDTPRGRWTARRCLEAAASRYRNAQAWGSSIWAACAAHVRQVRTPGTAPTQRASRQRIRNLRGSLGGLRRPTSD
jgi:hypothetical protein